MSYKLTLTTQVVRLIDSAVLPCFYNAGIVTELDPFSPSVQTFESWLSLGNIPAPADPAPILLDQNDMNNMTRIFRAKCISDLSFRLGVAPGALTAAQKQAERDRIKGIADALP